MRPLSSLFIASVASLILFFALPACKKTGTEPGYFLGTVDGTPFHCGSSAQILSSPQVPDLLKIIGVWSRGSVRILIIDNAPITARTYIIEQDQQFILCQVTLNSYTYNAYCGIIGDPGPHGTGTITISEITANTVRGSFQFTTADSIPKVVTGGQFYIKR